MSGLSKCQCCKKNKQMTEHHVKSMDLKINICQKCHNVVTEYEKYLIELENDKTIKEIKI